MPDSYARLRQTAGALAGRSIDDWRRLWGRVRADYATAIEDDLERISDRVAMTAPTLGASVKALLSGLDPVTLTGTPRPEPEVTLVSPAASVPGLAAQPLFPLLCRGSAVIFKPSSREPDSVRLLVEALERLDPEVAAAVAIAPGLRLGEATSNTSVDASGLDRIVAYGSDATVTTIRESVPEGTTFSPQGHGWSAVYLAAESITDEILDAVSRDVALFDQRGCLCPQVVVSAAPAGEVVPELGRALGRIAGDLPPAADAATLGALRQLRDATVAGGRAVSDQPLTTGLVVEGDAAYPVTGTPGGRSVRIYGNQSLADATTLLRPVARRLQSLSVAVPPGDQHHCNSAFASLGVARIVEPGELHSPGFDWVARQLRVDR